MIVFSLAKFKPVENSGKVFIKSDRINKYLGVHIFSYLIRNSPFKFLNLGVYLKSNSILEISRVYEEIRKAERNHIFAFFLVTIGSIILLFYNNRITDMLCITFSNVIFNVYPVLSLQSVKTRISKIICKQNDLGENRNINS
ncbi:glycosyl-4,4'-diaponeurosporenoate acyltransferase CrtO family protein [Catalinimonas niigatensis]|uniref:glycosyl-4,4'-diaponeurosporenoate acyltransferase CrtO family protein n=1 Tax=Catalinimonas niigatensis TaxID=1397264 RepID=UPI0038993588